MNTLTGHTQAVSHKGQVTGRGNSGESQNRDENRQPLTPYMAMFRWDRVIPVPELPIYFEKKKEILRYFFIQEMKQVIRVKTSGKCDSAPYMGKQIGRRVWRVGDIACHIGKRTRRLSDHLTSKKRTYWQDSNHCEGLKLLHDFDNKS